MGKFTLDTNPNHCILGMLPRPTVAATPYEHLNE